MMPSERKNVLKTAYNRFSIRSFPQICYCITKFSHLKNSISESFCQLVVAKGDVEIPFSKKLTGGLGHESTKFATKKLQRCI